MEEHKGGCSMYPSDRLLGQKYLARSCHVTRQLLEGMSWGSGGQKVLHSCPLGASQLALPGCHRARSAPRHLPSPRSCHQKAPEFAEGCVLPFVVFLPCLEKGSEV